MHIADHENQFLLAAPIRKIITTLRNRLLYMHCHPQSETYHFHAITIVLLLILICGLRKTLHFDLWTSPFVFTWCHTFCTYLHLFRPMSSARIYPIFYFTFELQSMSPGNPIFYDVNVYFRSIYVMIYFAYMHFALILCQHNLETHFYRKRFEFRLLSWFWWNEEQKSINSSHLTDEVYES